MIRSQPPIVETERLRLRAHEPADFAACCALWGDPEVVRHIGGQPSPPDAVWMRMMQYRGHWPLMGYGYWLVEERATGAMVGEAGLADFKRVIDPPLDGTPEAGWVIAPSRWHRGYATEAMTAVLGWAEANLGDPEIACMIDPDNRASLRVAAKLDFRETVRTTWRDFPTVLFRRGRRGAR